MLLRSPRKCDFTGPPADQIMAPGAGAGGAKARRRWTDPGLSLVSGTACRFHDIPGAGCPGITGLWDMTLSTWRPPQEGLTPKGSSYRLRNHYIESLPSTRCACAFQMELPAKSPPRITPPRRHWPTSTRCVLAPSGPGPSFLEYLFFAESRRSSAGRRRDEGEVMIQELFRICLGLLLAAGVLTSLCGTNGRRGCTDCR